MTVHWIEVKEGKWKMWAVVIGFKALSGTHSRENFGVYAMGLLDRVRIMDKKSSKVCQLFLTSITKSLTLTLISVVSSTQLH